MTSGRPRWGFLLDQLCDARCGIAHALAVSADGLLVASSRNLARDRADQLSAIVSGLSSLTRGAAELMHAEPVAQTVIDMRDGHLIVMAIGDGSILTALATDDADMGQVAYEMVSLINSVGPVLTPQARQSLPA